MAAVSGSLTQLPGNHEEEIRAMVSEIYTTPALMEGPSHLPLNEVTTMVDGML